MKKQVWLLAAAFLANGLYAHDNYNVRSPSTPDAKHEQTTSHSYKDIHTEELKKLLKNSSSTLVIVDARPAEDDDGKRIPGAKFLPFDASAEVIKVNLPNKDATIVVYCSGLQCPISGMMAERLVGMGYTKVRKYPEGIEGWESSGNKVDVSSSKTVKDAETQASKTK